MQKLNPMSHLERFFCHQEAAQFFMLIFSANVVQLPNGTEKPGLRAKMLRSEPCFHRLSRRE
jgi:hypothetical protein